jgi:hypothetical protein
MLRQLSVTERSCTIVAAYISLPPLPGLGVNLVTGSGFFLRPARISNHATSSACLSAETFSPLRIPARCASKLFCGSPRGTRNRFRVSELFAWFRVRSRGNSEASNSSSSNSLHRHTPFTSEFPSSFPREGQSLVCHCSSTIVQLTPPLGGYSDTRKLGTSRN